MDPGLFFSVQHPCRHWCDNWVDFSLTVPFFWIVALDCPFLNCVAWSKCICILEWTSYDHLGTGYKDYPNWQKGVGFNSRIFLDRGEINTMIIHNFSLTPPQPWSTQHAQPHPKTEHEQMVSLPSFASSLMQAKNYPWGTFISELIIYYRKQEERKLDRGNNLLIRGP